MEEVDRNLGVKFISFLAEECLELRAFSIFKAPQLSFAAAKMFSRFPAPFPEKVGDLVVTANSAARFLFPRVVSDAPIPYSTRVSIAAMYTLGTILHMIGQCQVW